MLRALTGRGKSYLGLRRRRSCGLRLNWRRSHRQGPTEAVSRSLPSAFPKELRGQGLLYRLSRHPHAASVLAGLFRAPSPVLVGGALRVLSVTVPATLGGTALTLWAMYALSAPTALASRALRRYLESGELPELPVGYADRAGRLMADVQHTIERLDAAVRSLEELAIRDHLTGSYNRRAGEERLAEDVERARREGGTLSLTLFDLDRLKAVNDEHGHRAGDAYLAHFAEVLHRNVRAADWVARWGGDEFVVCMWNTQQGQPTKRALERIVDDLRQNLVRLPDGEETRLTFSGGRASGSRGTMSAGCSRGPTKPST